MKRIRKKLPNTSKTGNEVRGGEGKRQRGRGGVWGAVASERVSSLLLGGVASSCSRSAQKHKREGEKKRERANEKQNQKNREKDEIKRRLKRLSGVFNQVREYLWRRGSFNRRSDKGVTKNLHGISLSEGATDPMGTKEEGRQRQSEITLTASTEERNAETEGSRSGRKLRNWHYLKPSGEKNQ